LVPLVSPWRGRRRRASSHPSSAAASRSPPGRSSFAPLPQVPARRLQHLRRCHSVATSVFEPVGHGQQFAEMPDVFLCCRQQAGGVSVDENSMQLSGYVLQQEVRFHSRHTRRISCSLFDNWYTSSELILGMWIHNFFPSFTYQLLLTVQILVCRVILQVCRVILQLKVKQQPC
jgi:hypothetical protein